MVLFFSPRPAQLSPLFFVLTSVAFSAACLNHTRPYTSSSLKYARLKCCVQSSPQLVLRISCCTLAERKYPLLKPVRSSFFLCLKSAFLICLLLKNHFQRAVLKCVFVIIWESCAFFPALILVIKLRFLNKVCLMHIM